MGGEEGNGVQAASWLPSFSDDRMTCGVFPPPFFFHVLHSCVALVSLFSSALFIITCMPLFFSPSVWKQKTLMTATARWHGVFSGPNPQIHSVLHVRLGHTLPSGLLFPEMGAGMTDWGGGGFLFSGDEGGGGVWGAFFFFKKKKKKKKKNTRSLADT